MTEPRDSRRDSHLAELRDELGEQFLRVARDEPRSRVRRRLRYAGITLVFGLLVVPAAVAISGGSSEGPGLDSGIGRVAACAELPGARAGVAPPPVNAGAEVPGRLETLPYLRELESPGKAGLRARDRELRVNLGRLEDLRSEPPAPAPPEACAIPVAPPALGRRAGRTSDKCLAIEASRVPRRGLLEVEKCAGTDDTVRLGVPGGRPLRPADPPAALRSDCLMIRRMLHGKGDLIEARPCRDAVAVPAEPPRTRFEPRR